MRGPITPRAVSRARNARTVFETVQPAVQRLAQELLTLSAGRPGAAVYQPNISNFFETGIVTDIYKGLLQTPNLRHLDIRHEMRFPSLHGHRPEQVDLWMRPPHGGWPFMIEAGDWNVTKIKADREKLRRLNHKGQSWFLAFFREQSPWREPAEIMDKSFARANGLERAVVVPHTSFIETFDVRIPGAASQKFGVALLRFR